MSAASTPETSRTNSQGEAAETGKAARLAGKLAALTGAAGAALSGEAFAAGITYTPTAGVAAAQNIPGFSFAPPTTVTPGTLRPPATPLGNIAWDVDGNGSDDFYLGNGFNNAALFPLYTTAHFTKANGLLGSARYKLLNLVSRATVGPAQAWTVTTFIKVMTYQQANKQNFFTLNTPGYFGFRFAFNLNNEPPSYYYGWAGVTIDGSALGQGYKITEAFYQTTPSTAIQVGDVPLGGPAPVPELSGDPSGIALLAAGFLGLEALRARRRRPALAC